MATSLPVNSTVVTLKGGAELVAPATNFATVSLTADEVVLSNRLSALDQEERLTYRARPIARVDTSMQIRNPAPVTSGVQYQIVLEETVRTTVNGSNDVVDEPVVMQMTVRHPRSGNITDDVLRQCLRRFMGAVVLPGHDLTDTVVSIASGANSGLRFTDLARFAEAPVRDAIGGTADSL